MKKMLKIMIPLLLIVMSSSLLISGTSAEQPSTTLTAQQSQGKELTVYIDHLNWKNHSLELSVDPIQWLEGDAASAAFQADEPDADIDGPPDGYYIVNDDNELFQYPVAKDAKVMMQIYDRTGFGDQIDINWNEPISVQKFAEIFPNQEHIDLSQFPYHLIIKDGEIVSIVQQYIP